MEGGNLARPEGVVAGVGSVTLPILPCAFQVISLSVLELKFLSPGIREKRNQTQIAGIILLGFYLVD